VVVTESRLRCRVRWSCRNIRLTHRNVPWCLKVVSAFSTVVMVFNDIYRLLIGSQVFSSVFVFRLRAMYPLVFRSFVTQAVLSQANSAFHPSWVGNWVPTAQAPCLWSRRVSCCVCLAEGYGNGDQRRPVGPCGLGRTQLCHFHLHVRICIRISFHGPKHSMLTGRLLLPVLVCRTRHKNQCVWLRQSRFRLLMKAHLFHRGCSAAPLIDALFLAPCINCSY